MHSKCQRLHPIYNYGRDLCQDSGPNLSVLVNVVTGGRRTTLGVLNIKTSLQWPIILHHASVFQHIYQNLLVKHILWYYLHSVSLVALKLKLGLAFCVFSVILLQGLICFVYKAMPAQGVQEQNSRTFYNLFISVLCICIRYKH